MHPPLKLNSIDQEHLQELYNASGVARDELPYTEAYETVWQGFQDRTFKNADREQLFALLKYTRSSSNAATEMPETKLSDDQLKLLKQLLARHTKGGKLLPYSDEFENAKKEFQKHSGVELTEPEFWRAIMRSQGAKRRPPSRKKAVAVETDDSGEDGE